MDRDPALGLYLVDIATRAAGLTSDHGLNALAEHRALPGPVHLPRDFDQEIREEIADARNYAIWAIQESYGDYLAGDPGAADDYERRMRALSKLVLAWVELHSDSA